MSVATFAYYPGCLALESVREYDASIRAVCRVLDIALEEVDDWNCCGAGVLDASAAARALANRVLELAGTSRPVVSGCPTCVAALQDAAGPDAARHVLGILAEPTVRERLAAKIADTRADRPLGSLKVACFYGQTLSDPVLWGGSAEGESWPMDVLLELSGATVVKWGGSRRSAGGYLLYAKPEVGFEMLAKVFRDFEKSGADAIVTADPHAHFNLDAFQYEIGRRRKHALDVPVFHVTELVALAMELEPTERWLDRHVTGTLPLIDRLCAEEEKRRAAK